jgi:hypothetical protein
MCVIKKDIYEAPVKSVLSNTDSFLFLKKQQHIFNQTKLQREAKQQLGSHFGFWSTAL